MSDRLEPLKSFLQTTPAPGRWNSVSMFAGAGLSDFGYRLAGFHFRAQVESEGHRAEVGEPNFPGSKWLVDELPEGREGIIHGCQTALGGDRLALLTLTPPCQGMSSSNPSRGRRHADRSAQQGDRNTLILETIPIANALRPRIIVAENVRPVVTLRVDQAGRQATVIEHLRAGLPDYFVFHGVVDAADYGIPQVRRRAVVVAVLRTEPWIPDLLAKGLLPWPRRTHSEAPTDGLKPWVSVREWLSGMAYAPLDARSKDASRGEDPLHRVPFYGDDRYLQVASIPPDSGLSAYENDDCPECGFTPVPRDLAYCPECSSIMRNRPYRVEDDRPRLIRGFHSSYRRMRPDRPAPTVTTNTSHVGSDFKIHPSENRVLSSLECADLQSVPRTYDWSGALNSGRHYLIRNVIGEAFPPYFTYRHGTMLNQLLDGIVPPDEEFATDPRPIAARRTRELRRSDSTAAA